MRTIGLIGGMSWESTQAYYRLINQQVKSRLGGLNSAKIVLFSVNFAEIELLQRQGDWGKAARILSRAALSLQSAGAGSIVICTNTMHKVASQIEQVISVPLLHIADATANEINREGLSKVGLLGTAFTMEQNFYKQRLVDQGIEVIIPDTAQRKMIHEVIFNQLCLGKVEQASKHQFLEVVKRLQEQGAEGIVLGCTEIGLLITEHDTPVPLFDTTQLHAAAAVQWALEED